MIHPNFVILYVNDPSVSAKFYATLLDSQAIEASPTFSMFALPSGVMLGLWAKHAIKPAASAVGGSELSFSVKDNDTVNAMHGSWKKRGLTILLEPTKMDFGFTFVASDPDGHRLRVFAPTAQ
jgi:predicted enzyme related to lactoylglutathione lyase